MQYFIDFIDLIKKKKNIQDETHYCASDALKSFISIKNGHKQRLALCREPALYHFLNDELFVLPCGHDTFLPARLFQV